MIYDVAVIGAGPSGLICATELEKLGEKTVVLEKDNKVGEPVECAGLFNIEGIKRLGLDDGDYILNKVKGAKFISASGKSAEVAGSENKAYVVDRGKFDRFLADKYPGELRLKTEVRGAQKKKEWELDVGVKSNNVVLATGYNQSLHKVFDFKGPSKFITTSQYEIEGVKTDLDYVELYLGSVAPGFFAWVIPIDEKKARVGLGVLDAEKSTAYYMQAFLKRLKKEGKFKENNKVVHKSGGLIPLFEPSLEVGHNDAFLVGDAASHVKATTGGGVMLGGLAAKALAKAIHEEINYGITLMEVSKELNNHLMIRNVINKFGDEQYEHMIDFLHKPEIKKLLEEHGDMDFAGPVMKGIMGNPTLMMHAMKFLGKGILF